MFVQDLKSVAQQPIASRLVPKTGETWKHYRGQDCYILGILRSGSRAIGFDIIAYELIRKSTFINHETGIVETTTTNTNARFFKPVEEFMGTIILQNGGEVNRFEQEIDEDLTVDIWETINLDY